MTIDKSPYILSLDGVTLTIEILIILLILGKFFDIMFKIIYRKEEKPHSPKDNLWIRTSYLIFLGIINIITLYYVSFIIHIPLDNNVIKIYFLANTAIAIAYITKTLRQKNYLQKFAQKQINFKTILILILIISSIFIRYIPYYKKFVYSGYDIKIYSLIATRITEEKGITWSWGRYGDKWYVAPDSHLIFSGASMVAAFISSLTNTFIPFEYSIQTLLFNALIPLATYSLIVQIFKREKEAIIAFIISIAVAQYPLFFIQWGGIGETLAWYIILQIIPFLYFIHTTSRKNLYYNQIILTAATITLLLVHPITFIYYLTLYITLILLTLTKKEFKKPLYISLHIIVAILLLSPYIYNAYYQLRKIEHEIPPGTQGWAGFHAEDLVITPIPQLLLLHIAEFFILPFLLLYLIHNANIKEKITPFVLWSITLAILASNSPFGLYFIKIPFWYFLFPNRIVIFLHLPLTIIYSFLLTNIYDKITHYKTLNIAAIIIAIILFTYINYYNIYATIQTVDWGNSLTINDIKAFNWIKDHIHPNATILGEIATSSFWIPSWAQIRVFCIPQIVNNYTIYEDCKQIEEKIIKGTISKNELHAFLKRYKIEYIYLGSRTEYDLPRYNLSALLKTELFKIIYKNGNAIILKVRD